MSRGGHMKGMTLREYRMRHGCDPDKPMLPPKHRVRSEEAIRADLARQLEDIVNLWDRRLER